MSRKLVQQHAHRTVISTENRKEKVSAEQLNVPEDTSNGMTPTLLKNDKPGGPGGPQTTLSRATPTSEPRGAKLVIFSRGPILRRPLAAQDHSLRFEARNRRRHQHARAAGGKTTARHPCLDFGRQSSAFVRFDWILYQGGPIWCIEPAPPVWPRTAADSNGRAKDKR